MKKIISREICILIAASGVLTAGLTILAFALTGKIAAAVIAGAVCVLLCAAAGAAAAKKLTDRIMKPINDLDLSDMKAAGIYDELTPFLNRIEKGKTKRDEAEKMRREFSANVSHELKTPLTSIYGYAQMITSGMAKPEDYRMCAEKIEKESSNLMLLIDDVIKLSHLDETEISTDELIDLSEITRETILRIEPAAKKRGVKIFYSDEPAYIKGSKTLISELVYNLIDNAVKYNKENGRVTVFSGTAANGVEFSVKDTGIGIPENDLERVFERFYRVDKSRSKNLGGTGLGLSIAKHAAMCHGAEIEVKSKIGEGTTVTVLFDKA